eukprot:TRINITY_DN8176_c0_g2_i5.p5 TRINITY_DN8176_c0_g2~~TRINITY_DN8176_c0_g2_i5.p5  ORF type:complete len:137 (+),score=6.82 TRINITY_DN8176_c0_g2_i5:31-441(+)
MCDCLLSRYFGLIVYMQRIDKVVGGFLEYVSQSGREVVPVNIAGYPGDKQPYHSMWYTNCSMIILDQTIDYSLHHCDTSEGMSGSPLFSTIRRGTQMKHSIAAIHIGGNILHGDNRAVAINNNIKKSLDAWIKLTS